MKCTICNQKGTYKSSLLNSMVLCDKDYELVKRLEAQKNTHGKTNNNKVTPKVRREDVPEWTSGAGETVGSSDIIPDEYGDVSVL